MSNVLELTDVKEMISALQAIFWCVEDKLESGKINSETEQKIVVELKGIVRLMLPHTEQPFFGPGDILYEENSIYPLDLIQDVYWDDGGDGSWVYQICDNVYGAGEVEDSHKIFPLDQLDSLIAEFKSRIENRSSDEEEHSEDLQGTIESIERFKRVAVLPKSERAARFYED
jgi:hypothetical protein